MLTDAQARTIACSWHGGGGTALYALCSTGAITEATIKEITDTRDQERQNAGLFLELTRLRDYALDKLDRGPVQGWSKLWDDDGL
jgi:hypothetical protein